MTAFKKSSVVRVRLVAATVGMVLLSCSISAQTGTIDKLATAETVNLYRSLWKLSEKHTLFGHQHATEYGHGWSGDADRSDVKSVTGSHPAVIGIDFSGFSGAPVEATVRAKEAVKK